MVSGNLFHCRKNSWPPEEYINRSTLHLVTLINFLDCFFVQFMNFLFLNEIGFYVNKIRSSCGWYLMPMGLIFLCYFVSNWWNLLLFFFFFLLSQFELGLKFESSDELFKYSLYDEVLRKFITGGFSGELRVNKSKSLFVMFLYFLELSC